MPARYKQYGKLWKDLNPDAIVVDHSWNDLPDYLPCQDVMDDLRNQCTSGNSTELPTQLADIIGYFLTKEGGIYANADIRPVKPLPEEMWSADFATYEEVNYPLVVNAFTGGKEGSPFWSFVLEGIHESYFSHPRGTEMVFTTGPLYLTRRIEEWKRENPRGEFPVTIYPYFTVNPILWKEVPPGRYGSDLVDLNNLPPGCVGVHDWGHKITGRTNTVS